MIDRLVRFKQRVDGIAIKRFHIKAECLGEHSERFTRSEEMYLEKSEEEFGEWCRYEDVEILIEKITNKEQGMNIAIYKGTDGKIVVEIIGAEKLESVGLTSMMNTIKDFLEKIEEAKKS